MWRSSRFVLVPRYTSPRVHAETPIDESALAGRLVRSGFGQPSDTTAAVERLVGITLLTFHATGVRSRKPRKQAVQR